MKYTVIVISLTIEVTIREGGNHVFPQAFKRNNLYGFKKIKVLKLLCDQMN